MTPAEEYRQWLQAEIDESSGNSMVVEQWTTALELALGKFDKIGVTALVATLVDQTEMVRLIEEAEERWQPYAASITVTTARLRELLGLVGVTPTNA